MPSMSEPNAMTGWPENVRAYFEVVERFEPDVVVEHDVHVLEDAGTHVVRLRAQQLFGHARPDHQGAL